MIAAVVDTNILVRGAIASHPAGAQQSKRQDPSHAQRERRAGSLQPAVAWRKLGLRWEAGPVSLNPHPGGTIEQAEKRLAERANTQRKK